MGKLAWLIVLGISAAPAAGATPGSNGLPPQRDRSPIDMVLVEGDRLAVTANETSDSLSLVDLAASRVLQEVSLPGRPAAVTARQGRVVATAAWSGDLAVFDLSGERLVPRGKLHLGFEPRGVALAADRRTAYVALGSGGDVAVIDLEDLKVVARIPVGRWPRACALSPDDSRLVVALSGEKSLAVVDTEKRTTLYTESFGGIDPGQVRVADDGKYAYLPWMVYRQNVITASNIRLGWVLGSRIGRVRLDGPARREAITLDPQGEAVSDPYGLDLTPNGAWLVATGSGTHELLVYRMAALRFIDFGGPGDHIERDLLRDRDKFYRLPLGGRPMSVRALGDNRRVVVANYLSNSLQVVDLDERKVEREIDLGEPQEQSLARRGAALFYDGRRSLDQWYSCHSCHPDGRPNAVTMDTHNDRSDKTFKTVPSLVAVDRTGPWTWHGWQRDISDAVRTSMTETMLGPAPTPEETEALIAFMKTIDAPPSPFRPADGAPAGPIERGRTVFSSERAGCARCHGGPTFTDGKIHDVGTGGERDVLNGYNTPTLLGVYDRIKLLHDGRSASLDDLLTGPHDPDKITGQGPLSPEERADLIAYLKSL